MQASEKEDDGDDGDDQEEGEEAGGECGVFYVWSSRKREWCCKHAGMGCPLKDISMLKGSMKKFAASSMDVGGGRSVSVSLLGAFCMSAGLLVVATRRAVAQRRATRRPHDYADLRMLRATAAGDAEIGLGPLEALLQ